MSGYLKVKAGSWHYWVWRLGRGSYSSPKNLCRYFWHVTFKIVAALIVMGLAILGVTLIGLLIYEHPMGVSLATIALMLAIGLIIGLGFLVGIYFDRREARKPERMEQKAAREKAKREKANQPPGTMSLIWTFIKAKKAKYCPLIEVVDK